MAGFFNLVGGATRPDAITGLNPAFNAAMTQLYQAAPPEVQAELALTSAYRSPEVQQALWDKSDKTGHTVARPGKSKHQHGTAADLAGFGTGEGRVSDATKSWVHANAGNFGLHFPMSYEPWHIQLLGEGGATGGAGGAGGAGLGATMAAALTPEAAERSPWASLASDVAQPVARAIPLLTGGSAPPAPPVQIAAVQPQQVAPRMPAEAQEAPSQLAELFKVAEVGKAAQRASERPGGQAKQLTSARRRG